MTPTDTALFGRIEQALTRPGTPSSDFDLNKGIRPPAGSALRPAGVLCALQPVEGRWHVILTVRSSALKHHPGQIAFPGGKQDKGDADPVAAALREAREEIGLNPENVAILGTLPTHETVTSFRMTPVVGRVLAPFELRPEPGEVAQVFRVPLAHLLDTGRYSIQARRWQGMDRRYFAVPWGPYYIWGATARILREFAARMQA